MQRMTIEQRIGAALVLLSYPQVDQQEIDAAKEHLRLALVDLMACRDR